jgi:hypothetical protein
MKKHYQSQKLIISLLLTGFLFLATTLFPQALPLQPVSAVEMLLEVEYALLNPEGNAYEVNAGEDGSLWVSDNQSGEIWHFSGDGNALQVYGSLGLVSDARPTSGGMVWFVNQAENDLVRLDPLSATTTSWAIPDTGSLFGTNVDNAGNIWVTKFNDSRIYRLTPGEGNNASLCEMDLTTAGYSGSDYIVDASGNLWLAGNTNQIIYVQLGTSTVDVTIFSVLNPVTWGFEVEGLSEDDVDGLWFADTNARSLVHLVQMPELRFLRYYLPSGGGTPHMITPSNSQIWFTGYDTSVIGNLDPTLVIPTSYEATSSLVGDISMSCETVSGVETSITSDSIIPQWLSTTYPITESPGWKIANLNDESLNDSYTWGITKSNGKVWVVDQGRQVLMRTVVDATITACKFSDADGELATTDDRAPIAGWGMTLYQDGASLGTQLTGENGCTSWSELPLGADYRVEEAAQEGWAVLEPADGICNLETITLVGQYDCDFVNWKEESNIFLPLVIK